MHLINHKFEKSYKNSFEITFGRQGVHLGQICEKFVENCK